MSNIDKQALRKLAVDAKELAIIKRYTKGIEAQKKFIAEMTPATVLALLDELEAKDKQIAEFELAQSLYDEGASMLCGQFDELAAAMGWTSELAEKQGVSQLEYARGLKRSIAELEARDKPKFLQCWSCKHDIEVLAIADCDGYCPRCAAQIDLDDEPYAAAGKGE